MGEFTSFSFGNWHSTDPNTGVVIVHRVSGGDRYDEQLHPEIKDRTAEVPGVNGEYYFGSDFGTRTFDIDIAFDSLTEEQLRNLRRVFGTKDIKQLIFDECPYKYYMAKLESPIELSYVCFDEPKRQIVGSGIGEERYGVRRDPETRELERIYPYETLSGKERRYKGEGKISLICYFPFAKSVYEVLPNADVGSDWAVSSGILTQSVRTEHNIDTYVAGENAGEGAILVYNPGDVPTGFRLYCKFDGSVQQPATYDVTITYKIGNNIIHSLVLTNIKKKGNDIGLIINTDNGLVQGVSNYNNVNDGVTYTTSGNLYNQYVTAGYFFKIEPTNAIDTEQIIITSNNFETFKIFYDYLYF